MKAFHHLGPDARRRPWRVHPVHHRRWGNPDTVNPWLHMTGTPEGVSAVYIMINTGTTYGGGATSTQRGPLQRVAGPMPAGSQ